VRYAAASTAPRVGVSWIGAVYLIIGGIVAATHHYWAQLHTLKPGALRSWERCSGR
jgi:hypothetical protein